MSAFTAPRKKRRNAIEHGIQRGLFDWRQHKVKQIPRLKLLHAVPNGGGLRHQVKRTASGKNVRYSIEGGKLRREGMTKGILDVCWPVARGRYHGLYIEHKAAKETMTDEQKEIAAMLREGGYFVTVSRQCDFSVRVVEAYWDLGEFFSSPFDCGPTMPDWALQD